MPALRLADARGRVVGVIISAHLAAKTIGNDPGAAGAVARLMLPARKDPFIAGETFKPPFMGISVHAIRLTGK
jgi:hypothetical protein